MRLGIDFGTTRTVVACADRGNYPVLGFVDDAGDSHDWVPSVVAEQDGKLLFGFDALAAGDRASVVRSFKRLLSGADVTPGRQVQIGSITIGMSDLVTRFLSAVRDAILALGQEHATKRFVEDARGKHLNAEAGDAARSEGKARLGECAAEVDVRDGDRTER